MGIGVNQDGVIVVVFARLGHEGVSIISMRVANNNVTAIPITFGS